MNLDLINLTPEQQDEVLAVAGIIESERAMPKPYKLFPPGTVVAGPFHLTKYAEGVGVVRAVKPGDSLDTSKFVYVEVLVGSRISGGYDPRSLRSIKGLRPTIGPLPSKPKPEWCPVCHTYHVNPGEKTDAGRLTRPCPQIPAIDPRNLDN